MRFILPLILIVTLANCAEEFQVYRMLQYDMPSGNHLGSRANQLSMEARTINAKPTAVSRKCVLVKLQDLSLERYRNLVTQYAGAIIVLLPEKYDEETKATIKSLETQLLHEEVKIPFYFVNESKKMNTYYEYIETERAGQLETSAFQTLMDSVVTNGFQFDISSPLSTPLVHSSQKFQAINIQGKLNGGTVSSGQNVKTPTIIVTAHYDAFGLATCLSNGCDSNGSGVVALLEIARIFSSLYSSSKTVPNVNILFLLTAEGKFNYHGLKKWIEEQSETHEMAGKIDLDDVLFAICLDSIGKPMSGIDSQETGLYAHVSRPPKEGQASFDFMKDFEERAAQNGNKFELVHKKINLANEMLAWDHERFSLNKIPALTLSHFKSFKDADRKTMTDTIDSVDRKALVKNIRQIVDTIAQYAYKNKDVSSHLFNNDLDVSEDFVSSWLENVCGTSRAASLLNKNHPLVNNLFSHFNHYLQEAVKYPVKVQAKEPEFVFYNQEEAKLMIYNVKPAVFDFFLALTIGSYLGLVYLFVLNFSQIFNFINRRFVTTSNGQSKSKSS